MESKEIQKDEEINPSSNSKPSTQSLGIQIGDKNSESKNASNYFCISYKELFITPDNEKEKEEAQSKQNDKAGEKKSINEEEIKIIHQLFNIPLSSPESFKNKDFKIRYQNNKNITFVDEFTVKYIGKGISKIDYGIVQTEKEILNKRPIF